MPPRVVSSLTWSARGWRACTLRRLLLGFCEFHLASPRLTQAGLGLPASRVRRLPGFSLSARGAPPISRSVLLEGSGCHGPAGTDAPEISSNFAWDEGLRPPWCPPQVRKFRPLDYSRPRPWGLEGRGAGVGFPGRGGLCLSRSLELEAGRRGKRENPGIINNLHKSLSPKSPQTGDTPYLKPQACSDERLLTSADPRGNPRPAQVLCLARLVQLLPVPTPGELLSLRREQQREGSRRGLSGAEWVWAGRGARGRAREPAGVTRARRVGIGARQGPPCRSPERRATDTCSCLCAFGRASRSEPEPALHPPSCFLDHVHVYTRPGGRAQSSPCLL